MKVTMRYTILYINDLQQSLHFYHDILGLPIRLQQGTYIEFDTGATVLAINTRSSVTEEIGLVVPESSHRSQTFELGFVVDDVSQTIDTLRQQNVPIIKEPVTKPWGQTVAYVADPDGHYIEICSAI